MREENRINLKENSLQNRKKKDAISYLGFVSQVINYLWSKCAQFTEKM